MEAFKNRFVDEIHTSEEVGYLLYCPTEEEFEDSCIEDVLGQELGNDFIQNGKVNWEITAHAQPSNQDITLTLKNTNRSTFHGLSAESAIKDDKRHIKLEADEKVEEKTRLNFSSDAELGTKFRSVQSMIFNSAYGPSHLPNHGSYLQEECVARSEKMYPKNSLHHNEEMDTQGVTVSRDDIQGVTLLRDITQGAEGSRDDTQRVGMSRDEAQGFALSRDETQGVTTSRDVICEQTNHHISSAFFSSCNVNTASIGVLNQRGTQAEEKSHQCRVCNKRFSQSRGLSVHMRIHTGEKPYECSVCKKRFSQRSNRSVHMRIHTRENPYQCSVCPKRFSRTGALWNHIRIFHTGQKAYSVNNNTNNNTCIYMAPFQLVTDQSALQCIITPVIGSTN